MGELTFFHAGKTANRFKIDYPHYGLFGSASITPIRANDDTVYECQLLNGTILLLKKLAQAHKWIDANQNRETPLSSVIGSSIDDFLKIAQ